MFFWFLYVVIYVLFGPYVICFVYASSLCSQGASSGAPLAIIMSSSWQPFVSEEAAQEARNQTVQVISRGVEAAARVHYNTLSHRLRKVEEGRIFTAHKRLRHEEVLAQVNNNYWRLEEARARAARENLIAPPAMVASAIFRTGQSVLQWWAPWMRDAPEPPATYQKNRPAWFSAEILGLRGVLPNHRYAGMVYSEMCYQVY